MIRYKGLWEPVIARIEDMPYNTSIPMQFSLTQTGSLVLGQYVFSEPRINMSGTKNIRPSTLIYLRSISFSADIPVLDYQGALQLAGGGTQVPKLNMFLTSDANSPTLRDPILLDNYFSSQDYRMIIEPTKIPVVMSAYIEGVLQQTAALAGITEINMSVDIYAQSIEDKNFIRAFKAQYPEVING